MAWTPVLLMTSYLTTIVTDHHLTYLKMRARDRRTATENFRCWCFIVYCKKKIRKTPKGGGGGGGQPFPHPLVRLRVKTQYVEVAVTQIIRVWNQIFYSWYRILVVKAQSAISRPAAPSFDLALYNLGFLDGVACESIFRKAIERN